MTDKEAMDAIQKALNEMRGHPFPKGAQLIDMIDMAAKFTESVQSILKLTGREG